jgi:type III restriction enzyme
VRPSQDCTPGQEYVEFNTGKFVQLGAALGGQDEALFQKMIYETVEQHFQKERALKARGIKVLSLFFVDKVSSYRLYAEDGSNLPGIFAKYFEDAYQEISQKPIYRDLIPYDAVRVHNGYFSQDKKSGQYKDSSEGRDSKDDEDTYNLIMRDKERLLDPEEPLRFIFSHTALREGWDNPNIFQICTLREVGTDIQRRQQIGRGLRLPVNVNGERVKDDMINRLTVISNENYKDFAKKLQTEYESDFGIKFGKIKQNAFVGLVYQDNEGESYHTSSDRSEQIWQAIRQAGYINQQGDLQPTFAPHDLMFQFVLPEEFESQKSSILSTMKKFMIEERIGNAKERRGIAFNKRVQLSDDFQELWKRISQKTRYRVTYQTNELIENAVSRIYSMEKIPQLKITVEKVELDINQAGVRGDNLLSQKITSAPEIKVLPDILAFLQKETELTRHTLVEILKASKRLEDFKINPQLFMDRVAKEIQSSLYELMLKGIQYEKIAGQYWEMQRLEEDFDKGLARYLKDLYAVQNPDKSIYDFVEFDSDVEKEFARQLDMNVNIRLFVKLPSWFKIDTPIGPYNPDWAFVTEREEKLYFVRETKSTHDSDDRRNKENHKIRCGQRHFDSLGVDYGVVTSLAEVDF